MSDEQKQPSIAELVQAQKIRREAKEARRIESEEQVARELRERQTKWDGLVAAAQNYTQGVNTDLDGTGIRIVSTVDRADDVRVSSGFGKMTISVRRNDGGRDVNLLMFTCGISGYVSIDTNGPKEIGETQNFYLENVQATEMKIVVEQWLRKVFSAP